MEKVTIKLTLRDMKNVVNTTTFQILKNINNKRDSIKALQLGAFTVLCNKGNKKSTWKIKI